MMRLFLLLAALLVVLTGCNSTRNDERCLFKLLHRGDFVAAEAFLLNNPVHINGEYVDFSDVDPFAEDDWLKFAKCSFTKGSPLLWVFSGNPKVIKWLIDHGARIDQQRGTSGGSPLHTALSLQSTILMVEAAKKIKIVNSEDANGKTALYYAIVYENYPIAEYLLKNGAHINQRNSSGKTILDLVIGEIHLIGGSADYGGQDRVVELKRVEAWIRENGGMFSIELARRWVKERNEHDDLLREHYKKSMTPEEIEDFLKNKP